MPNLIFYGKLKVIIIFLDTITAATILLLLRHSKVSKSGDAYTGPSATVKPTVYPPLPPKNKTIQHPPICRVWSSGRVSNRRSVD